MSRTRHLDRAFREARMFDPAELRGPFAVRMLTLMPSLHRLGHRKVFLGGHGCGAGTNLFFDNLAWGRFSLETDVQAGPEPLEVVVINYDCPGNLPPTRLVRDHVRCQDPGRRYLGQLNVLVGGRVRFLAYFLLVKADAPVSQAAGSFGGVGRWRDARLSQRLSTRCPPTPRFSGDESNGGSLHGCWRP